MCWRSTTIIEATVSVPASKVTNDLQVRTVAAVRRHCRHKLGEAAMSEARACYENMSAIPRNILVLAFACVLCYGVNLLNVEPFLKTMLSVVIAVFAWVPLWNFCDMMFLNSPHWIHQHDKAIYQAVESMTITIKEEPTCV
ncbi:hypothetical protein ACHAW5_006385 [Stephanodiscus triporus]|uniref:Uncharacterized protein n=1 Tax=Stephanodiscus triporus TaxID=2934178 RepID=A0ABD3QTX3_9STRA